MPGRAGSPHKPACESHRTSQETEAGPGNPSSNGRSGRGADIRQSRLERTTRTATSRSATRASAASGGTVDGPHQRKNLLRILGLRCLPPGRMGSDREGDSRKLFSNRKTTPLPTGVEESIPNGAVSTQPDRKRFRVPPSRVPSPDTSSGSTSSRQAQRPHNGGITSRTGSRSDIDADARVASEVFRLQQRPDTKRRQIFRLGVSHSAERQRPSGLEHGRSKRIRECAALQESSGPPLLRDDAQERQLPFDRFQTILPHGGTERRVKEFRADLGRPKRLDTTSVQHKRTHNFAGKHGSLRGARRAEGDGKAPETAGRVTQSGRPTERPDDGRYRGDGANDHGPRAVDQEIGQTSDRTGPTDFLEEVDMRPTPTSAFLRTAVDVETSGRVHQQEENASDTAPDSHRAAEKGFLASRDSQHYWKAACSEQSDLSRFTVDKGDASLGVPKGKRKRLGQSAPAISKDAERNRIVDAQHSKFQRAGGDPADPVRGLSRRRSRIWVWRNPSSVARSDSGFLASGRRKSNVLKPTGAESRRQDRNTFHSEIRHQEHGHRGAVRQQHVNILHQQARRESSEPRLDYEDVRRTVSSSTKRASTSVSHTRAGYNRNGGRRVLAWKESPVQVKLGVARTYPEGTGQHPDRLTSVQRNRNMSPPDSADKRPRGRSNTDIPQPSMVAHDPPDVHVVTDSDHEAQRELDSRGIRATEYAALPLTPRLASLERLLESSKNPYLSPDFIGTQLAAARADKGKIYDLPWQRWVQFSARHEDAATTIGLGPEWDISIPKFTAFLTAIRDGFGNVKKDCPSYIKNHSSAVLTTLALAGAIDQSILVGLQQVRQTSFHRNVWSAVERRLASTNARGLRSTVSTTVLDEDKCWDPGILLEFWHNFPSAVSMQKAKWPAALITKLVRAKAVAITRTELAARSADVTTLSWSLISPRFPLAPTTSGRRQISVQLYNTKPDKIKKRFGKLTKPKLLMETKDSNSCVVKTLNELLATTPFDRADIKDDFNPVFVSERLSKDAEGRTKFKALSAERLSNIVKLSYIGANITGLLPKHIRNMAASKADASGLPEKVFLSHCQWTDMATFKKFYKRQFKKDVPKTDSPLFGDALRSGFDDIDANSRCVVMRRNIERILSASARQVSQSSKSSGRALRTTFKITQRLIDNALFHELGRSHPLRKSRRIKAAKKAEECE